MSNVFITFQQYDVVPVISIEKPAKASTQLNIAKGNWDFITEKARVDIGLVHQIRLAS